MNPVGPRTVKKRKVLDATTLGAVLAFAGVVSGSVVAYVGKRGEASLLRFDQVQEERDRTEALLSKAQNELMDLHHQHREMLLRITRLEIQVLRLGEDPVP